LFLIICFYNKYNKNRSNTLLSRRRFCERCFDDTTYFFQMRAFLIFCLIALITSAGLTHGWLHDTIKGRHDDADLNRLRDMLGLQGRYVNHRKTSSGHTSARVYDSQLAGQQKV